MPNPGEGYPQNSLADLFMLIVSMFQQEKTLFPLTEGIGIEQFVYETSVEESVNYRLGRTLSYRGQYSLF